MLTRRVSGSGDPIQVRSMFHAAELLTLLPDALAADTLEMMQPDRQVQAFDELDDGRKLRLVQLMAPDNAADLLFDDVLWVSRAQQEHDAFANVLRSRGVVVHYYSDLLAQTRLTNARGSDQANQAHRFAAQKVTHSSHLSFASQKRCALHRQVVLRDGGCRKCPGPANGTPSHPAACLGPNLLEQRLCLRVRLGVAEVVFGSVDGSQAVERRHCLALARA